MENVVIQFPYHDFIFYFSSKVGTKAKYYKQFNWLTIPDIKRVLHQLVLSDMLAEEIELGKIGGLITCGEMAADFKKDPVPIRVMIERASPKRRSHKLNAEDEESGDEDASRDDDEPPKKKPRVSTI